MSNAGAITEGRGIRAAMEGERESMFGDLEFKKMAYNLGHFMLIAVIMGTHTLIVFELSPYVVAILKLNRTAVFQYRFIKTL